MTFQDDINRMLNEASDRIEQEFTGGGYDVPDVREAAVRAGFEDAPETVTVSYITAGVDLSERDEDW